MRNVFEQISKKSLNFIMEVAVNIKGEQVNVTYTLSGGFKSLPHAEATTLYGLMASYLETDDLEEPVECEFNEDVTGSVTLNLNYNRDSGWKLTVEPSESIAKSAFKPKILSLIVKKLEELENQ